MNPAKHEKSDALRKRAEALLAESPEAFQAGDLSGIKELAQELAVYQAELELQNEELREAQLALQESRDRFAALYGHAPVGYVVLDGFGIIRQTNATWCAMLNREGDDFRGVAFTDAMVAEDAQIFLARFRSFFRNPTEKQIVVRMKRKSGAPFHARIEAASRELQFEDSTAIDSTRRALLVIVSDITDLHEARKRLDAIIEFLPDATFVIDAGGRVIAWNMAIEKMTGVSKDDMFGKGDYEYAVPFYGYRRPILIDLALSRVMERHHANYDYIRTQGDVLSGEVYVPQVFGGKGAYLWGTASVLRDSSGKVFGAIESIRDVSDRKTAEQALKASELFVKDVLDALTSNVAVLDHDGKILAVNKAWKCFAEENGLADEGAGVGSNYLSVCGRSEGDADESAAAALRGIRAVMEGLRDHFSMEYPCHSPTLERWFLMRVSPLSGDTRGVVVTHDDITDRKRAEQESVRLEQRLQQTAKAESLTRMAGATAHNFNNMLGAVIGNLEFALEDAPHGSELRTCVGEAMSASRRAAELSRFMLTYLGQTVGKRESLDLREFIGDMRALLRASIPGNIHLDTEPSSEQAIIRADRAHLRQITTNLVLNAVEAIGEAAGRITLGLHTVPAAEIRESRLFPFDWEPKADAYALLSVSDTGCGLDDSMHEKIFDPFFSTRFTGRGLGLSVVLGLARAHGGAVGVRSRVGQGSTFDVYLPLVQEELPRKERGESS